MILLLEDNPGDAALFQKALRTTRSSCMIAGDASEAMRLLESKSFNVVVVDLRLPGVDGWSVLESLAAKPNGTQAVVLTSSANQGDRARAAGLGVGRYLIKPDDFAGLLKIVAEISALDSERDEHPGQAPIIPA